MTAGLPGSGVSGLFYLVLVALMPIREAWLTACGESSWKRWRLIAEQWMLVTGILATLWGQGWLFRRFFTMLDHRFGGNSRFSAVIELGRNQSTSLGWSVAYGGMIALVVLCLAVQALRLWVYWMKSPASPRRVVRGLVRLMQPVPVR